MASNTENLNLLMKNPSTDGADTFNVQTMLNENWQKIDNNAGTVAQTLANILKPTTPPIIGLPPSTTPDGMFQALGNTGELHVWRKTVTTAQEIPAGYTLGDAESGTAFSVPNAGSQNYVTLQYGPSITVNDAGGVSLTSVTGSVQFQQYSNVSAIYDIRNNFVKAIPNGTDTSAFDGVIFVPNDCSFKNTAGIVTFGKFYRVNAYPLTPARTTTTYPVSTNPNAYQEGDDAKEAGYTLGDATSMKIIFYAGGSGYYVRFYTADSVSVSDSGALSIVEDNNSAPLISKSSDGSELRGKYIKYHSSYQASTEIVSGMIYFVPSNAVFTWSNGMLICDKVQLVTGYAAIPAGTTIEYLGKLGDKAMVRVVSYVGTGTYGSSNPNSLTFDFVPKIVVIQSPDESTNLESCIALNGSKSVVTYPGRGYSSEFSWNKKTVSWYSQDGYQLNDSGQKYYAIAIG